jgi:hypothetical protein
MGQSSADHVRGQVLGSQIAGVFGVVFVGINSAGLPSVARTVLLVLAGAALVAIIALSARTFRRKPRSRDTSVPGDPGPDRGPERGVRKVPFGWRYWLVVGIEAVALFAGSRVVTGLGYPELGVAWVSVVVGTHFFALARIFHLVRFTVLGAVVTACGLAGFVLRIAGEVSAIAVVSGVVSGFVLLSFGLWAFAPARKR